jgi:hypothetical protein
MGHTKTQKKRLAKACIVKTRSLFMAGIVSSKDVESVGRIMARALKKIG